MKKLDYCPECSIGLNSRESEMGFCQNCEHSWDKDDSNECCDECGGKLYYDYTGNYYVCKECKLTH